MNATAATTLERARNSGSIRIGVTNEAPFSHVTPSGDPTGEAPEIAKRIFKRLGIGRVNAVMAEPASLIPGLRARRFDAIAAGMFVTPERCTQVAFSNPTYRLGEGFLVEAGNPLNLHSYEDAIHNEATVAIMAGAIEHYYVEKAGIPDDRLLIVPDRISLLSAVQFGRADAAALSALSIQRMAQRGGDRVEIATPFKTPDYAYSYGAFAFRKEDAALLKAVNKEMSTFIGSKEHLALVAPFGVTADNMPGKMTSAALCGG